MVQRNSAPSGLLNMKTPVREALRQAWTDKAKNLNFLQIITSRDSAEPKTRRNLIALASINTLMFGAVMGAMNVMLLYSEVGDFPCPQQSFILITCNSLSLFR